MFLVVFEAFFVRVVAHRLVLVGRVLLAIRSKLIDLGAVLVGVGGGLIEIGTGLIAVRRRVIANDWISSSRAGVCRRSS